MILFGLLLNTQSNSKCIRVLINYQSLPLTIKTFVPIYKALSTNLHPLRQVVNLINHIKFVNYLYYSSKITLHFSLHLIVSH